MIAALSMLGLVIAIMPVIKFPSSELAAGLLAAVTAVALAILTARLPSGDLRRLFRLLNPLGYVVVLLPLTWMLLQILPLTSRSLINPIWVSSSAAMGWPVVGAISLDIGATLLSVSHYSAVLGIALLTAAIALNKSSAEVVLILLTMACTVVAAEMIIGEIGIFDHSPSK